MLNVMRDQLDRFGEIDYTARLLEKVAAAATKTVVLNRDDPRVSALATAASEDTQSSISVPPRACMASSSAMTNSTSQSPSNPSRQPNYIPPQSSLQDSKTTAHHSKSTEKCKNHRHETDWRLQLPERRRRPLNLPEILGARRPTKNSLPLSPPSRLHSAAAKP
jgi:hypothetical protein